MWESNIMMNLDCTPVTKKKPRWSQNRTPFFKRRGADGRYKNHHRPSQTRCEGPPPHQPGSTEKTSTLIRTTLPSSSQGNSTPSTSSDVSGNQNSTVCPSAGSSHKPASAITPARNPSKILAIDCEMVGTGPKGSISQLARCSIVSYDGDVVYDRYIKPVEPVTDYRSRWSGIRAKDLANATPYAEARKEVRKLLIKGWFTEYWNLTPFFYSPLYRWRHWWHFPIHTTVLKVQGGKEFHLAPVQWKPMV